MNMRNIHFVYQLVIINWRVNKNPTYIQKGKRKTFTKRKTNIAPLKAGIHLIRTVHPADQDVEGGVVVQPLRYCLVRWLESPAVYTP